MGVEIGCVPSGLGCQKGVPEEEEFDLRKRRGKCLKYKQWPASGRTKTWSCLTYSGVGRAWVWLPSAPHLRADSGLSGAQLSGQAAEAIRRVRCVEVGVTWEASWRRRHT